MFDNDAPTRKDMSLTIKWALAFVVVLTLVAMMLHIMGVFTSVATAPGRVVNKTLDTDNIITSYEWFFDTNANFSARVGQIKAHATFLKSVQDDKERQRLMMELAAMQQSCRELVTKYNANSAKMNKSAFKSDNLPNELDINDCER